MAVASNLCRQNAYTHAIWRPANFVVTIVQSVRGQTVGDQHRSVTCERGRTVFGRRYVTDAPSTGIDKPYEVPWLTLRDGYATRAVEVPRRTHSFLAPPFGLPIDTRTSRTSSVGKLSSFNNARGLTGHHLSHSVALVYSCCRGRPRSPRHVSSVRLVKIKLQRGARGVL